ncbi:putative pectinesterase 53 isoform X1 [Silene latifolia]|uniref:putative pectinesterase 53 isoform X1 n=1 Tax=Silene latifolia TaxID=37657 RepID=UPI003D76FB0D
MMILPLLSIFCVLQLQISSATNELTYEEWLHWNVKNQHRRSRVTLEQVEGVTTKVLDVRLENAESNPTRLIINQDGSGDYTSIAQALNTIPPNNTRRFLLHIAPGLYREKIHIPKIKPFISFVGDVNNPPTITGNDTASITRGAGSTFNTFQTATVGVDADYFIALNIIFQNTAPHEVGRTGEQAVALRISGNKAAFYNCSFYGSQDTLYDHKGLHYFRNCFIQGSVDFIFGYGRSFYENCTLNSIAKKVASVTAQKRSPSSMSSGFSFKDCSVTGSGLVYLGRAWGDYSRVVFTFTFLDKLVLPQAWSNWGNPLRNLTVYYGEYKCSGPGSNMTGRVPWARALTDEEAQPFVGTHFVEGDSWLVTPFT